MGTTRLRHPHAIGLHFAADGKTLISAGQDQTVRFWDRATGKLQRLQRLPSSQQVMALSADGKTVALTSEDYLHLWDIAAAKEIRRISTGKLRNEKYFNCVEFSPDGKSVAAGNRASTIRLWDTATGKERARYHHKDTSVQKLAFAPDGRILAAVGFTQVVLWDVAAGKELGTLPLKADRSISLTFSADSKQLAAPSLHALLLWDVATQKEASHLPFDSDKNRVRYYDVAFAPDGRTMAIGFDDCLILWERATGKEVKRLPGYGSFNGMFGRLLFSPDGKWLAALRGGKITLWDVESGKKLPERGGHSAPIDSAAVSPDGKYLASAAGGDRTVRLWDAHSGKPLHVWPMPHGRISPLLFSADSGRLIAGGLWGDCRMWDTRDGRQCRIFSLPKDAPESFDNIPGLTLSADGKSLTAISLRRTFTKNVAKGQLFRTTWNVDDGKIIQRQPLAWDTGPFLFHAELSPDGRLMAIPKRQNVLIYDVRADRLVRTLKRSIFGPSAFSPDSTLLALGGHQGPTEARARVFIHDLPADSQVLSLAAGRVWNRVFSPDSRYLLTAGESDLCLWELASGKEALRRHVTEPATAPGAMSFATCLAFSADGRCAVAGMHDTTVLLYDLAPGAGAPSTSPRRPRWFMEGSCQRGYRSRLPSRRHADRRSSAHTAVSG